MLYTNDNVGGEIDKKNWVVNITRRSTKLHWILDYKHIYYYYYLIFQVSAYAPFLYDATYMYLTLINETINEVGMKQMGDSGRELWRDGKELMRRASGRLMKGIILPQQLSYKRLVNIISLGLIPSNICHLKNYVYIMLCMLQKLINI